jgi:hypothetical protein
MTMPDGALRVCVSIRDKVNTQHGESISINIRTILQTSSWIADTDGKSYRRQVSPKTGGCQAAPDQTINLTAVKDEQRH